jgi:TIR domain
MTHDVFISHSSKDKVIADAACGTFEANGIRCWVAPRDVPPGSNWGAAIIDAIERSRIMVLIFSDHANGSGQIAREIERAASRGITIVPIRIENVLPARSLEFFLSNIHWLDALTPPLERRLQEIAARIKVILKGEDAIANTPAPQTAEPAAPGPVARKGGRTAIMAFIGAVIVLGLAFAFWRPSLHAPSKETAPTKSASPELDSALIGKWAYITNVLDFEIHVELTVDSAGHYTFRKFFDYSGQLEDKDGNVTVTDKKKSVPVHATYSFPADDQLLWLLPDYKLQVNYRRVGGERIPAQPLVGKWHGTNFLLGLNWDLDYHVGRDLSFQVHQENADEGLFKARNGEWEAQSDLGRGVSKGIYRRVTPESFDMSDPFFQLLKFERVKVRAAK